MARPKNIVKKKVEIASCLRYGSSSSADFAVFTLIKIIINRGKDNEYRNEK